MTAAEFNARYPRRLLLLADRAISVILDGVPYRYEGRKQKSRNLKLRAYYETLDVHHQPEAIRVVLEEHQSERSLRRILQEAFTDDEALRIRKVWSEPLFPDYSNADGTS